jgi:drug/metabolite transporter (DMT)-like permease
MASSGYLYLLIIYIVWGTTYLAMRVGVGPGSGFPVFAFGAVRCLVAAGILLALAGLRGQKLRPTRKELPHLILTGVGMWLAAHGMVLAAERTIASGFAAVAVSTSPIWVLLLGAASEKRLPDLSRLLLVGIGFLGVVALIYPQLRSARGADALSLILLILSPVFWAYCALHIQRFPFSLPTIAVSGYQHLFGGLGFLAVSVILREPVPAPTPAALGAMIFLIVFGSVIAFTAYVKALTLLPAHVVMTNTYVNPVLALVLGWAVLGEKITPWMLAAILLVGISVAGILRQAGPARCAEVR